MRLLEMPSPFIAITLLSLTPPITASFIPPSLQSLEDLQDVHKRCANPCGYYGQLCCASDEVCYTDGNNQAQCGAAAPAPAQTQASTQASGYYTYWTTTYLMTDYSTVTSTLSSFVEQTTSCEPCNSGCQYSLGETPCGNTCCKSGYYCQQENSCVAVGGGSSGLLSSQYTVTTIVTNTASAAARPTSNVVITVTSTGNAGQIYTTTQAYDAPVSTGTGVLIASGGSGGGGLSGGAIAGIVIGVIAAIIILLLICACCCFKGLLDGLLALFGLGPRKRRRTEEVEVYESHHHHGSGSGAGRRTWFGTRPKRSSAGSEKRDSGWGRIAGVSAFLGGLALLLGMKRKRDRKDDKNSVSYGSSYYSDYTSSKCSRY